MIKFKIAPCALSFFIGLSSMYFSIVTNAFADSLEDGLPSEDIEEVVSSEEEVPPGDSLPEESTAKSRLVIQALNPGYSSEQGNDKNEFIELKNNSGEIFDLSGVSIRYTYGTSKKQTIIYEFTENSAFNGEFLLLRFDKSPEAKEYLANVDSDISLPIADDFYSTTLAASGGIIELLLDKNYGVEDGADRDFEVLDSLCWFNEAGCEKPLSGKRKGLTIYRTESGFSASGDYSPHFMPEKISLVVPEEELEYEEEPIMETEDDVIKENDATKEDDDGAAKLKPCAEGYERNPETNRCRKIQTEEAELKECAAGYERNPETNRCKKIQGDEVELKECAAGYERNPETNRCKKIQTAESTLKECQEGYERNQETNRCRKIQTEEEELKECAEGYERNPETNRCRKIKENTGADYSVEVPETGEVEEKSTFIALVAIIVIVLAGVIYVFFQYRKELSQAIRKILKTRQK